MKRSRAITLVLMSSISLVAAGCDSREEVADGQFFSDPAQCRQAFDAATCDKSYQDSLAEHVKTAPTFTSKEACEQQFGAGNCMQPEKAAEGQPQAQAQAGGGGFFMPLMMGYLMGRTFGGGYAAQPVYRDATNTAYAGSRPIGNFDRATSTLQRGTDAAGRSTASRGGFGGTASRYGGGAAS